jgi:hypothetical protein
MRLVLPTLWSPSKTILVRLSVPVETSVVGDVAVAMSGCCKQEGAGSVSVEEGVNEVGQARTGGGLSPSLGKSLLFEVVDVLCPGPGPAMLFVPRALRGSSHLNHGADLQTVTSKGLAWRCCPTSPLTSTRLARNEVSRKV